MVYFACCHLKMELDFRSVIDFEANFFISWFTDPPTQIFAFNKIYIYFLPFIFSPM